jgi:NADPH:quinone reductase-like Zn-dependent oxidoreductase
MAMKAYELTPGGGLASLVMVERPSPALGPLDVRVRIRAASLNYRVLLVAGIKTMGPAGPAAARRIIPLSDAAGEVVAAGAEVRQLAVGDRVAASFFPGWRGGARTRHTDLRALGGELDGVLAEEVVLPEAAWVKLQPHLTFEEAATLPCAGVTAYTTLFEAAPLAPGGSVLVQGTGGVAMLALQLARAAGASVIATSSSAAKAERARALGAQAVIDYAADPAWGQTAYQASDGGVDIVVETGGPASFAQSVAATRIGGAIGIIGVITGERGDIDLGPMRRKSIHVFGVTVGSAATLAAVDRAIAAWAIRPIIDRVFAFDQARAAFAYLASGAQLGKVVIRV